MGDAGRERCGAGMRGQKARCTYPNPGKDVGSSFVSFACVLDVAYKIAMHRDDTLYITNVRTQARASPPHLIREYTYVRIYHTYRLLKVKETYFPCWNVLNLLEYFLKTFTLRIALSIFEETSLKINSWKRKHFRNNLTTKQHQLFRLRSINVEAREIWWQFISTSLLCIGDSFFLLENFLVAILIFFSCCLSEKSIFMRNNYIKWHRCYFYRIYMFN